MDEIYADLLLIITNITRRNKPVFCFSYGSVSMAFLLIFRYETIDLLPYSILYKNSN
jgi:methionine salvage enolase-phosphatase E1